MTEDQKQKLDEAWKRVQELKEREQALPSGVTPVEISPPAEDDSSSDGPPELIDQPPEEINVFPRLAHSESSSQESE
jgi:hypothetical protein